MEPSTNISFMTVVTNLATQAVGIGEMLYALAYMIGVFFVVSAMLLARASADPAARADHSKTAWVWSLGFGALMIALPSTIGAVAASMFGSAAQTSINFTYVQPADKKLAPLVPLLSVIGVIAVIRGLVVLRSVAMYGNHSRGNNSLGRGLTFVIAGVLLVHMKIVLAVLTTIIGINLGANMF